MEGHPPQPLCVALQAATAVGCSQQQRVACSLASAHLDDDPHILMVTNAVHYSRQCCWGPRCSFVTAGSGIAAAAGLAMQLKLATVCSPAGDQCCELHSTILAHLAAEVVQVGPSGCGTCIPCNLVTRQLHWPAKRMQRGRQLAHGSALLPCTMRNSNHLGCDELLGVECSAVYCTKPMLPVLMKKQ